MTVHSDKRSYEFRAEGLGGTVVHGTARISHPGEVIPGSAYSLVDIPEIKDAAKMEEYKARVTPVVEKFGGRSLVIGGPLR